VEPDENAAGLDGWIEGAGPEHPLRGGWVPPEYRKALEEIIRSVVLAQPLRWAKKRDAFRAVKSREALLEQRAELLGASLLARAGVPFEFAKDHPDLVLEGEVAGIEVGTRAIDHPWRIHDDLEAELAGVVDLLIMLNFDGRPLILGAARVVEIVGEVAAQVRRGDFSPLRYDDAGLTVGMSADAGIHGLEVMLKFGEQTGSELTEHMFEIDREIDNLIERKRRQATKLPTLLLMDFSRSGWSWLRPGPLWLSVLRSKLDGEPWAGLGLMVSTLDSSLPLGLDVALNPSAPDELHLALERVAEHFNLTIVP
jgi:hypothetical protein